MSDSIQSIRQIYDCAKSARDNNDPLSNDMIASLLDKTVSNKKLIACYSRFQRGYAAEDLFLYIFSCLPWVRNIVPLGQEQFPKKSKNFTQVPDYEISYEVGSNQNYKSALVEVKLVDGDKQTHTLRKIQYNVLKSYATQVNRPLLFAIFWRKYWCWTINSIESFKEKSSSYKLSFKAAVEEDLSALFGDYTYIFSKPCYRKSRFSTQKNICPLFFHQHQEYGQVLYEGLSTDRIQYVSLSPLEPAALDCLLNFKEIQKCDMHDYSLETIEKSNVPFIVKLSTWLLLYLHKLYCFYTEDLYCKSNIILDNAFDIVDTVRRKCGGQRSHYLPHIKNNSLNPLLATQFSDFIQYMKKDKNLLLVHNLSNLVYPLYISPESSYTTE